MANSKCFFKINPAFFCAKTLGVLVFSFCAGMLAGLCLPMCIIAALETLLLIILAWMCLFKW